jgi:lysophospholipase L1-like esterase
MRIVRLVLLLAMTLTVAAQAQNGLPGTPLIPPHALKVNVVLFGHSWIYLMEGFQPWAFPNIPSSHISIEGYPGYTCQQLLPLVSADVPASTNAVFVMAATNDVIQGVLVTTHIECMKSMVGQLIVLNPHMVILLSDVPPLGIITLQEGIPDKRSVIAAYNRAYATLPQIYPNNVVLVDMWTPLVDTTGWGLANILDYGDGVHFGPNGRYAVMGIVRDGLYAALPQ